MARAATTKVKVKDKDPVTQTTAITNWDEEMAKQAEAAASMEANAGGGSFFSIKGGILAINDVPVPGNQMGVVIVDSILENKFYEEEYDPNTIVPPTCFALGRDELTMAPHEVVVTHGSEQHASCQGCPMNAFGTADKGKGKACSNRRRVMVIPAGEISNTGAFTAFDDEDQFISGAAATLSVPPMSVKGYANYVKQVAGTLKRPPHAVFTRVKLVPDPKAQFKLLFEPLGIVPNELIPILMQRHEAAHALIEVPYSMEVDEKPQAAATGRGKAVKNQRPPVKKAAAKKY